jgi:hypothetical protein
LKEEEMHECAVNGENGGYGLFGVEKGFILVTFLLRQLRMKYDHFIEMLSTMNARLFHNKQNVRSTAHP